jgi:hypothetical protein
LLDLGTLKIGVKVDDTKAKAELESLGKASDKAESKIGNGLARAADLAKTALVTMAAAGAAALAKMGVDAFNAYASFEQLEGGVKKLFGADAQAVFDNANAAFLTAGMSANDYMQTVTTVSANLISSLEGDTAKAAQVADMAIQDMADNANVFGTSLTDVVETYQSLAKGNYQMLDNLKLGFAGTKEGMQDLLDKATELSGIEYSIDSYADIVSAIHVIQEDMKITGTTSKEAAATIEGSINTMKAAYENWLVALANPDADLTALTDSLVQSIAQVVENAVPVIGQIALSLGTVLGRYIAEGLESIGVEIPEVDTEGFLSSLSEVVGSFQKYIEPLQPAASSLIELLLNIGAAIINDVLPPIMEFGEAFYDSLGGLYEVLGPVVSSVVDLIGSIIQVILQVIEVILPQLTSAWENSLSPLFDTACEVLEPIAELVATVFNVVAETLLAMADLIAGDFESAIQHMGNAAETGLNGVSEIFGLGISDINNKASGLNIVSTIGGIFESVKSTVSTKLSEAGSLVSSGISAIKNAFSGFASLPALAGQAFQSVVDSIRSKFNTAKSTVSSIVGQIKAIFPFSLGNICTLNLPHISVNGGSAPWGIGGKGTKPSFNVTWYAKGALFPANAPQLIGVGDNTRFQEAVLPLSPKVLGGIGAGIAENMAGVSTYNNYNYSINGISFNDDAAIRNAFIGFMNELKRKGALG